MVYRRLYRRCHSVTRWVLQSQWTSRLCSTTPTVLSWWRLPRSWSSQQPSLLVRQSPRRRLSSTEFHSASTHCRRLILKNSARYILIVVSRVALHASASQRRRSLSIRVRLLHSLLLTSQSLLVQTATTTQARHLSVQVRRLLQAYSATSQPRISSLQSRR